MKKTQNIGFDGRQFLTEDEWRTYLRRMPVRYIKKSHDDVCSVCGYPGEPGNPLEHSHRIGFRIGIVEFGLTPDFLDSHENIVSAHKRGCNSKAEMNNVEIANHLRKYGLSKPSYI